METVIPDLPHATVLIATKNRADELRRALASVLAQTPPVAEVLVIDDGSTDGTAEMVRREFPAVRLQRYDTAEGLIVRRNDGAALASNPIVLVIDDDATFSTPHTVAQTLAEFDCERVGAVAIPFVHHTEAGDIPSEPVPQPKDIYVTGSYVGTAHALRRDVFLRLGGYRSFLFHYGEERDFCTRLIGAGYVIRRGSADFIHHWVSPKREHSRQFIYGPRNHILYTWHNVPMPYLPAHWAATVFNLIRMGIRSRHPWWVLRGILAGQLALLHELFRRAPITRASYRLLRMLNKSGPVTLSDIQARLEPVAAPETSRPTQP